MIVGDVVSHSPVGPGIITDFTERGYPRVNRVAVGWVRLESGEVFDPHQRSICCELCSRIHETGDEDRAAEDGWLQGWDGWECPNHQANSHGAGECTLSGKCDCIGTCKHGRGGHGAGVSP